MSVLRHISAPITSLRACPDCGCISVLHKARHGVAMACPRCGKNFRRAHSHSLTWSAALAATGLLFYIVLITAPLLEVMLYNRPRWSTVTTGLQALDSQGFGLLTAVIFATAILVPLLKLLGLLTVLISLRFPNPPRWVVPLFRHLKSLNAWAMAEIFLLGFLVAYTRLQELVHVHLEIAAFALIGLVLAMVSIDAMLDAEAVWEEISHKIPNDKMHAAHKTGTLVGCPVCHQATPANLSNCMRCDKVLTHRKTNSVMRSWALVVAAALLYAPANLLPILQITKLKHTQSFTIWGGIEDFLHSGAWPLALLVFVASMMIPLFKLASLVFMLLSTRGQSKISAYRRTHLYRFVDFIGRWSMIDIFMLSILVGLVRFGQMAQITSDTGAICFAAVVVLTMSAVITFDPRLMWDNAAADKNTTESNRA